MRCLLLLLLLLWTKIVLTTTRVHSRPCCYHPVRVFATGVSSAGNLPSPPRSRSMTNVWTTTLPPSSRCSSRRKRTVVPPRSCHCYDCYCYCCCCCYCYYSCSSGALYSSSVDGRSKNSFSCSLVTTMALMVRRSRCNTAMDYLSLSISLSLWISFL